MAGRYLNICAWAALLLLAVIYWSPLAPRMTEGLAVPAREEPADVIVVLGGGVYEDGTLPWITMERLVHGVTLYHRGLAPRIIIAGGNPMGFEGITEADVMGKKAHDLAVPSGAVFMESASNNTHENAKGAKELIERMGAEKVLLVTSAYHMRRSAGAFRAAGIEVLPAPAPRLDPHLKKWDRIKLFMMAMHEYMGIEWYRYKGWYKE